MRKIRRHKCKSLREFNKIVRKYIKYFRDTNIYRTYWYTWIWVDLIGLEEVRSLIPYAERLKSRGEINLACIIDEVLDNYGWSFKHKNGDTYYLKGIEISNEDYYYIYVSRTGDTLYGTCVGRFTDIEK